MSYIKYNIYKSLSGEIDVSVNEVLRNVSLGDYPIRLVFFTACGEDYGRKLSFLRDVVKRWYPFKTPLVTLVAQRTLDCCLAVEIQSVSKKHLSSLEFKYDTGVGYAILLGEKSKMFFSEGVRSAAGGVREQSDDIFEKLKVVFQKEGFKVSDIDRQWNYLENITGVEWIDGACGQRYQEFNDSRTVFYSNQDWSGGYPAATGIGTQGGGVLVEVDAAIKVEERGMRTVGIDNNLQVSAHKYSEDVLCGEVGVKTTPKFERAKAIVNESIFGDTKAQIYISGTAAIRGEESLANDVELQTVATLENIENLISKSNLKDYGVDLLQMPKVQLFRLYLKHSEDLDVVRRIVVRKYPAVSTLYVQSDVCRDELLVEIEGIAE